MSNKRFTEKFKLESVKLIKERQYSAANVLGRLGVSTHSFYAWIKKYEQPEPFRIAAADQQAAIKKLQAELKRVAAVDESFFQLLKRERIRRKVYSTREEA